MRERSLRAAFTGRARATPRRVARVATLVVVMILCGAACGRDECDPGECEPCVGEECVVTCVRPGEEYGYFCEWECSRGATCDLECEVACCLTCDASDCTSDSPVQCSNGADCTTTGFHSDCDGSRCDHDCPPEGDCVQVCRNGSDCELSCGTDNDRNFEVCSAACDGTSACHVACEESCVLCCNGSTDCSMDCPDGGQSCEGDAIVCGTDCPVDPSTIPPGEGHEPYNFCPSLERAPQCGELR